MLKRINEWFMMIPGVIMIASMLIIAPVNAAVPADGSIVKGPGSPTLYFVSNGQRYVFPNANIFYSWYPDFSAVKELTESDLAALPLAGNVQYRPGVALVKLQTDPKVYAVSADGELRWIETEEVAQSLYGNNWNLLVDDLPDSFFFNYRFGNKIAKNDDFDPEDEESYTENIRQNLGHTIRTHVRRKLEKTQARICRDIERRVNRIQERLKRRGVSSNIGDEFLARCITDDNGSDTATSTPGILDGRKIKICHIPPGDPASPQTIVVAKTAARAHLAHGDKLGECEDVDEDEDNETPSDTTPPIITNVFATPSSTASSTFATIGWVTNEPANSMVTYATSTVATASTTLSVSNPTLVTNHSVGLTGLTSSTTYYFIVKATDASNNTATGTEQTFVTP